MFRFSSKTPSALGPCPCSAPVSTSLAHRFLNVSFLAGRFLPGTNRTQPSVGVRHFTPGVLPLKKIKHTLRTDNTVFSPNTMVLWCWSLGASPGRVGNLIRQVNLILYPSRRRQPVNKDKFYCENAVGIFGP